MASISLQNIKKAYGDAVIVKELSVDIQDGELVVLVGPSGCGKTTLLRMIAGLLEPSSGKVLIDGQDVTRWAPGDRDIAMVFQSYALYPHMTVFENIAFPLRVRRATDSEIQSKVQSAAALLHIDALLERRPRDLSGGQRQRVAMGRAIVREPKAFLFDEPLSNLDAALRAQMRGEIASLHRRLGATMVYVTHDQHEAMTLADRLILLNKGVIEQMGKPLDVYQTPATRFVGEFIGSPPMNFITADADATQVTGASFSITRSALGIDASAKLPDRVLLGVRPEAMRIGSKADPVHVEANIDWVERTGSDGFLYGNVDGAPIVARIPADEGRSLEVGQSVQLTFSQMQLFDESTGQTLA